MMFSTPPSDELKQQLINYIQQLINAKYSMDPYTSRLIFHTLKASELEVIESIKSYVHKVNPSAISPTNQTIIEIIK